MTTLLSCIQTESNDVQKIVDSVNIESPLFNKLKEESPERKYEALLKQVLTNQKKDVYSTYNMVLTTWINNLNDKVLNEETVVSKILEYLQKTQERNLNTIQSINKYKQEQRKDNKKLSNNPEFMVFCHIEAQENLTVLYDDLEKRMTELISKALTIQQS